MMPTIRVDQEVFNYLNERGKTADTFNDVLRRELGLDSKGGQRGRPRGTARSSGLRDKLENLLDIHLPAHWSETPARKEQILMVVREVLGMPQEWSITDRELKARKTVSDKLGIDPNSVLDKYGRQLYGEGSNLVGRFREALESIVDDHFDR